MSKTQDDRFGRTLLIRVPKTHNPSYRIAPFDSKVPHQVRNLPCPFLSLLSQDILIQHDHSTNQDPKSSVAIHETMQLPKDNTCSTNDAATESGRVTSSGTSSSQISSVSSTIQDESIKSKVSDKFNKSLNNRIVDVNDLTPARWINEESNSICLTICLVTSFPSQTVSHVFCR